MIPQDDKIRSEIVYQLVGTSGYMDEVVRHTYQMEQEELERLMEEEGAFRCAVCGWWCGEDDVAESGDDAEPTCMECGGE